MSSRPSFYIRAQHPKYLEVTSHSPSTSPVFVPVQSIYRPLKHEVWVLDHQHSTNFIELLCATNCVQIRTTSQILAQKCHKCVFECSRSGLCSLELRRDRSRTRAVTQKSKTGVLNCSRHNRLWLYLQRQHLRFSQCNVLSGGRMEWAMMTFWMWVLYWVERWDIVVIIINCCCLLPQLAIDEGLL